MDHGAKSADHLSNSGCCWVYQTLLRIRQLQTKSGINLTSGYQIINMRVAIATYWGKDRIEYLSEHEQNKRQKHRDYRRK